MLLYDRLVLLQSLGHAFLEHAMYIHVPSDTHVQLKGVLKIGIAVNHRIGTGSAAVGHEGMEAEIGANLGVILQTHTIGKIGGACLTKTVIVAKSDILSQTETGQVLIRFVLFPSPFGKPQSLIALAW